MQASLILLVGFIYLIVAIQLILSKKYGLALAFAGYAVSNLGLYYEAIK